MNGWRLFPILVWWSLAGIGAHAADLEQIEMPAGTSPLVDLSYDLSDGERHQVAGDCHTFAAAELFEASCFRRTQQHVLLSRDYLFYRHLRRKIAGGYLSLADSPPLKKGEGITPVDGGFETGDFKRILDDKPCTQAELDWDSSFYKTISDAYQQALTQANAQYAQKPHLGAFTFGGGAGSAALAYGIAAWLTHQRIEAKIEADGETPAPPATSCKSRFRALARKLSGIAGGAGGLALGNLIDRAIEKGGIDGPLRKQLLAALDAAATQTFQGDDTPVGPSGFVCQTKDPSLLACEQGFHYQDSGSSNATILSELKQGRPVICTGDYKFKSVEGEHAALIVGYAMDQAGKPVFRIHTFGVADLWVRPTGDGCPYGIRETP